MAANVWHFLSECNDRFRPIAAISEPLHPELMFQIEPNAAQYRTAALALIIVAASTAAMVAFQWVEPVNGLLLPAKVAYLLFNFGYVFALVKGGLRTTGARLGAVAVALNLTALLIGGVIWTALSLCGVIAATVASFLLFGDARVASS